MAKLFNASQATHDGNLRSLSARCLWSVFRMRILVYFLINGLSTFHLIVSNLWSAVDADVLDVTLLQDFGFSLFAVNSLPLCKCRILSLYLFMKSLAFYIIFANVLVFHLIVLQQIYECSIKPILCTWPASVTVLSITLWRCRLP